MSEGRTTVTGLASYRNETPYPFCPGCGHGPILDVLNGALRRTALDPRKIVLVSDIGCSGLSDQYFATSAFHGLHGRSITYATGIKLARPDLTVIVLMGDGGTGIGGTHLINAARRNIGITVLVFDNFNFGMTGGQHSTTTPAGARTSTTPHGNLERPLDVCATVAVNGASFVHRGTSFDADLEERLAEAIATEGFALLDVWELCTAYFTPRNQLNRQGLQDLLRDLGLATGTLHRGTHPEFARALRERAHTSPAPEPPADVLEARFRHALAGPTSLLVCGSAGGHVRSAVRLAARAALLSGAWAAQRDDYPVTVKTGHSLAELVLSPEPIDVVPIDRPDALLVLTPEGARQAAARLRTLDASSAVYALPEVADLATRAPVHVIDPATHGLRVPRASAATALLVTVIARGGWLPAEALRAACALEAAEHRETTLRSVRLGLELAPA